MAMIGVEIADAAVRTRIVAAICGNYRYQATVPGPNPGDAPVPNPVTKGEFAVSVLKKWLKEQVQEYELNQASEAARKAAADKIAAEVVIP